MAKFSGKIGYAETAETAQSVYSEEIKEQGYFGDVLVIQSRWDSGAGTNGDIKITNQISVVADDKALKSFHLMRYVEWDGVKWEIASIKVQRPRIILTLGGLYNEDSN